MADAALFLAFDRFGRGMAALEVTMAEARTNNQSLAAIRRELLVACEHSLQSQPLNDLLDGYYHHTSQREFILRAVTTMEPIAPKRPNVDAIHERVWR